MIRCTSYKELCEELEKNEFGAPCFVGLDTIDKDKLTNSYICIEYESDGGTYADDDLYSVKNNITVFLVSKDIREFNKLNAFVRRMLGVCPRNDREDIYYRATYECQMFVSDLL